MTEFVHLIGSEDIKKAGSSMCNSALEMNKAAASLEDSLHRHRLFLDNWLFRLEEILRSNQLFNSDPHPAEGIQKAETS